MAKSKKNNPVAAFIFGGVLIVGSTLVLWKNEHRFNYHQAAKDTAPVTSVQELSPDQIFSYGGPMDQSLTFPGDYVTSFTGYLEIRRRAEIYAWDREEDDEGTVRWSRKWMSSPESNSRNSGIVQKLSDAHFKPKTYQTGDLTIDSERIKFVDHYKILPASTLTLSEKGNALPLTIVDDRFYLAKGQSNQLGDERLSFRGPPVPATATYFGKFSGKNAIAHQAEEKSGFISGAIGDTGVLHHLVAGHRETALATLKKHFLMVKWITRGVGTFLNVMGWIFLFSAFTRFLVHLPVIGSFVQWGVFLLGLTLGLTLSVLVIMTGFITSHPILLVAIAVVIAAIIYFIVQRAKRSQSSIRENLEQDLGQSLDSEQIKELEFIELVKLADSDQRIDPSENRFLTNWIQYHGFSNEKVKELTQQARESGETESSGSRQHITQLIRLALADGQLEEREMRTIRKAAKANGMSQREVAQLIGDAKKAA